jgi:hypothetical protein
MQNKGNMRLDYPLAILKQKSAKSLEEQEPPTALLIYDLKINNAYNNVPKN